jgi:hypothetical protein
MSGPRGCWEEGRRGDDLDELRGAGKLEHPLTPALSPLKNSRGEGEKLPRRVLLVRRDKQARWDVEIRVKNKIRIKKTEIWLRNRCC